jgi:hypothetical protein
MSKVKTFLPSHSFGPVSGHTEVKILKKQRDVDYNVDCEDKCMAQTRKEWDFAKQSASDNPR